MVPPSSSAQPRPGACQSGNPRPLRPAGMRHWPKLLRQRSPAGGDPPMPRAPPLPCPARFRSMPGRRPSIGAPASGAALAPIRRRVHRRRDMPVPAAGRLRRAETAGPGALAPRSARARRPRARVPHRRRPARACRGRRRGDAPARRLPAAIAVPAALRDPRHRPRTPTGSFPGPPAARHGRSLRGCPPSQTRPGSRAPAARAVPSSMPPGRVAAPR